MFFISLLLPTFGRRERRCTNVSGTGSAHLVLSVLDRPDCHSWLTASKPVRISSLPAQQFILRCFHNGASALCLGYGSPSPCGSAQLGRCGTVRRKVEATAARTHVNKQGSAQLQCLTDTQVLRARRSLHRVDVEAGQMVDVGI